MFGIRLICMGIPCLAAALSGCASVDAPSSRDQDIATIVKRFEHVRDWSGLPYPRMALKPNPFFAAAQGFGTVIIDEQFAGKLSDGALSFALAHEIGHLRYRDPPQGFALLKKINYEEVGEFDQHSDFMALLGRYRDHPEFAAFELGIESRADLYATEYMNAQEMDACSAIKELTVRVPSRLVQREQAVCNAAAFRAD